MIRFQEIKLLNFGPFRSAEVKLGGAGVVFVTGVRKGSRAFTSNGAGKTMLFSSIPWCLFGRPAYKHPLNRGAKSGFVEVLFLDGAGNEVSIKRACEKPQLSLTVAGTDQTEATVTATQEKVERIIGMSADTFMSTVFYRQGQALRFLDMTDTQRKELLKEISHLEVFDECLNEVKGQLNALASKLQTEESELMREDGVACGLKANAGELRKKSDEYEGNSQAEIAALEGNIEHFQDSLRQIKPLRDKAKRLEGMEAELNAKLLAARRETEKHRAQQEFQEKRLKAIKVEGGECPTCEAELTPERKRGLLTKSLKQLEAEEKAVALCSSRERAIHGEFLKVSQELQALRRGMPDEEGVKGRIEIARKRMDEIRAGNPFQGLLEKNREETLRAARKASRIKSHVDSLKAEAEAIKPWLEAFGNRGVVSAVLDSVVGILSARANEYLDDMTAGELSVELASSTGLKSGKSVDKIGVTVIANGAAVDEPSGGQAKRVSVALGLALSDLVFESEKPLNILIMDEISSGLDEAGKRALVNILTGKLTRHESIFVIDHDPDVSEAFNEVLTVEMDGGVSCVIGGA